MRKNSKDKRQILKIQCCFEQTTDLSEQIYVLHQARVASNFVPFCDNQTHSNSFELIRIIRFHSTFEKPRNIHLYYALNKILNSDWLTTNLTLVDVWLEGSNVRQRNLMSG